MEVHPEVTSEVSGDPALNVPHINDIKKEFSLSEPNSHVELVKHNVVQQDIPILDDYIKSDNEVPIKLELMHEEIYIKSEILSNHEDQLMEDPTEDKIFRCNLCKFKSTRKSNLRNHIKIHTGEKPYKCNVCDYKCTLKHNLQRHMEIHTGKKHFKCNLCDYKCTLKHNLQRHLEIHAGEKPFKCNLCDYICTLKQSLQKHMKIHTGEKPYKCNICKYRGTLKDHLQTHMKIHGGEKPFQM